MKTLTLLAGLIGVAMAAAAVADTVDVASGVNHQPLDQLLTRYVNERGWVDYKGWKNSAEDVNALRRYTQQFGGSEHLAGGNEKAPSLINAYNALTIQWILENYPTHSIRATANPWGAKRHRVGGRDVSLDEIEHDALRPMVGFRVHAVLVCAARSCPPLGREAYRAESLDAQLDEAMRAWLEREDLNRFSAEERRVELSSIFSWFREDFDKAGGIKKVLAQYAPDKHARLLAKDYRVDYLPYNWGLNDQDDLGKNYTWGNRVWDGLLNVFR